MKCCDGLPAVKEYGGMKTLLVKGRPFLMLAGEIHNSGAGGLSYIKEQVWPYVRHMNLNTLFVPVAWEQIEARQGQYDFHFVKVLIEQARAEKMHLVLLWFGLWKNGASDYVPAWLKKDQSTFFRAENEGGIRMNCISPFCEAAVMADAAAFAALLGFLREFDQKEQTVLMIQVENETGLLGSCRDFSAEAERIFHGSLPPVMEEYAGRTGSWEEIFGKEAGECMMAWAFASAVEKIARAGQQEYALPMYTNAWLEQYPFRPGTYPAGGPTVRMSGIWKHAAPALFGIEPDIYLPEMKRIMEAYHREENPLLIPEARRDAMTASYAIYAVMAENALGYAPFGIEDIGRLGSEEKGEPCTGVTTLGREALDALQISASAYEPKGTAAYLAAAYKLIGQLQEPYFRYRGTRHSQCFIQAEEGEQGAYLKFENYEFLVTYDERKPFVPVSCGGILELDQEAFLLYGCRCRFEVYAVTGSRERAEVLRLEEGEWTSGGWRTGRILNGDEKQCCRLGDMPRALMLWTYRY